MKCIMCTGTGGLEALSEETIDVPKLEDDDILVELKAAAMNPVDVKNREGMGPDKRVLGYDGSGVVKQLGPSVKGFSVGDEVMFAGDITRNGTNAEMIAVDARICAKKPASLSHVSASALPLVGLTAWELLFENLRLPVDGSGKDLVFMMLNGAGGVGSMALQLARQVLGCGTVIGTASREETKAWCEKMGATHVINHHNDLGEELKKIGVDKVDVCFCGVDMDKQFDRIVKVMRSGGHIGGITIGDSSMIDVNKLFIPARLTLSFEFMFARSMLKEKPEKQGEILTRIAQLVDEGKLKDIANTELQGLSLETIKEAHTLQASGKAVGKIVIKY